jgi:hypothetical protein
MQDHYLVSRVAFIGTRRVDAAISNSVLNNANYARKHGYKLTSGGAKGVDTLAYEGFHRSGLIFNAQYAMDLFKEDHETWCHYREIADECHPNFGAVMGKGWYVVNLMVRNVIIVDIADIVLAWPSPDRKGGTEHGITVARYLNKPLEIMS